MRNPDRIPLILKEIENIWSDNPDLRLGQLIANVFDGTSLYYVEDEQFVDLLKDMYKNNEA